MTEEEWKAFEDECINQVALDRKHFGIKKSEYIPYAKLCNEADYLIVLMEPGPNEMRKISDKSYSSFGDWHINYCAHKYLCGGEYKYRITDMSKGAMFLNDAKRKRYERYERWLYLLEQEWKLFKRPKIIACKTVYDFLQKSNLEKEFRNAIKGCIYHPSDNEDHVEKHITKEYDNIGGKGYDSGRPSKTDWENFVTGLMKNCGWLPELIGKRSEKINAEYDREDKFAIYKWNFESLANKEIVV